MPLIDTHQLVWIEKSLPGGRVTKKDVNTELAELKKSDKRRSSFTVDVFSGYLKETRNHQSKVVKWLDEQGLPWGLKQVLIINNKIPDVMAKLDDEKTENEKLYEKFLVSLPENMMRDKAAYELGDLFSESDYKTYDLLKSKWKFQKHRGLVPDPDCDPRAGWSVSEAEEMKKTLKSQEDHLYKEATRELLKRASEPLKNVVNKCKRYDGGKDGRFNTKSFINNVRDVVNSMVDGNLRDDPEIENIRKQMLSTICPLDPKSLRESESMRTKAAQDAEDILLRIGSFGSSV